MKRVHSSKVVYLNSRTCGVYKNGGPRFKTDPKTGCRTEEIDDELNELVDAYLAGKRKAGITQVSHRTVKERRILVPTYYDERYDQGIADITKELGWRDVTIGELIDDGTITAAGGHGSPGNDQRTGSIPYIKVSDIRGLRININPTNLVTEQVAERLWHGKSSGLEAFDLITPNRASSNIGEFAILLPGEEQLVLTKEVFVFRLTNGSDGVWDAHSLLWSLCLRAVRDQWRRIALMQTNREDCGNRHREIRLPLPPSRKAAQEVSKPFRTYFTKLAAAKKSFLSAISADTDRYIASVLGSSLSTADSTDHPA